MKKFLAIAVLALTTATGSLFCAAGPAQSKIRVFNNTDDQVAINWVTKEGIRGGQRLSPKTSYALEQPRYEIESITYSGTGVLSPDHIVDFAQLHPGSNLLITINSNAISYYDTISIDALSSVIEGAKSLFGYFTNPAAARKAALEKRKNLERELREIENEWELMDIPK